MPVHDWSQVDAGIFHHFHVQWTARICDELNSGILPSDYYALGEQRAGVQEPDVLTLHAASPATANGGDDASGSRAGGIALQTSPPQATIVETLDELAYAQKQRTIVLRHVTGDRVVAMVEIVSRGNKSGEAALRRLVSKAADAILAGINLLIVDLQPPSARDPQGIHGKIWEELGGQAYVAPPGKPLTLVSYQAAPILTAYVEPLAVGDSLKPMALFLEEEAHVMLPLEPSYAYVYDRLPTPIKQSLS